LLARVRDAIPARERALGLPGIVTAFRLR